jgi:membrane-associated protease RseP (regulator of RpoE activity)
VRSLSITAYALSAECALSPKLRWSINRLSSAELCGEKTLALNMTSQGGQSKPSVGFIGMGHVGSTMAKRLIEVGYPLTIYDRTKERAQEIAQQGVAVAQTPKVLAAQCEVVMLCVTDDGPAARAGLRARDIIYRLNDRPVMTVWDLRRELEQRGEGSSVRIGFIRPGEGTPRTAEVRVATQTLAAGQPRRSVRGQ